MIIDEIKNHSLKEINITVDDKTIVGENDFFFAWAKNDFHQRTMLLQKCAIDKSYFREFDNKAISNYFKRGTIETLKYLNEFKDQPEKFKAMLILANLFRYELIGKFRQDFDAALKTCEMKGIPWDHPWKYTLPDLDFKDDVLYDSRSHNKEEIKEVLIDIINDFVSKVVFVKANYVTESTKLYQIAKDEIIKRDADLKILNDQREIKYNEDRRQKEIEFEAIKTEHPLFGQWHSVSKEELTKMVWSKPTVAVAHDFNVSDSAVGESLFASACFGRPSPIKPQITRRFRHRQVFQRLRPSCSRWRGLIVQSTTGWIEHRSNDSTRSLAVPRRYLHLAVPFHSARGAALLRENTSSVALPHRYPDA